MVYPGAPGGWPARGKMFRVVGVNAVEACPLLPNQNPRRTHPMLNPRAFRDCQTLQDFPLGLPSP